MAIAKLGVIETRFANIIWEHAPMSTKELITICAKELQWKRTTTYTVLKKLCERGLFRMEDSMITVLLSKEEFSAIQSEQFVENNFQGSLPAFIAAFTSRREPTQEELEQIRNMIERYGEKNQ